MRLVKSTINGILRNAGVKLVNAQWGPRGFAPAFYRIQQLGFSPKQIVDVGASNGQWTRECLEIFPNANYLLVDPLEENVASLKALQAEQKSVQFWHGALGSMPGWLPMHVHGDQSSFLVSEYASSGHERSVEIRTLDSFLGNELKSPPDLIKADVQGYEVEVLKGAERCMTAAEVLLLEVSYRMTYKGCPLAHEVISFVGSRGFRIYDICTYTQRPRDRELFQSDMIFVKSGSKVFEFEGYT